MQIKATFKTPRLSLDSYKQALQAAMSESIAHAAFLWLHATTARIPVWSGASMATFLHLASAISLPLSISPVVKSRIPLGLQKGEGHVDVDATNGKFTFTYGTTLGYLIYNEFHNANLEHGFRLLNPGPYQFQQAGREAFEQYASSVRLPDPHKHITIKTFRVT